MSRFLQASLILRGPLAYVFLKNGGFLSLQKIVWVLCSVAMPNELGMDTKGRKTWKKSEAEVNFALPMGYMASGKARLDNAGYTVRCIMVTS